MKVTRIQADNLLGLKIVDVKLSTAITLFAGRNGSGKSSIQEAVRMAITRDTVRDINLKKDYAWLVLEGEKAGGAQVMVQGAPMDDDTSFAFNLPKGEFTGPEINDSMRVALYGQRFAGMKPDDRRTFLFELTKCKRNGEAVKARMLAKKWACQEAKIDAVLPLLRTGFPSVCDHAKSKATEAKGAWRQLTGETYGAVKAESWAVEAGELPPGDVAALADQVAGIDRNLSTMNESMGAIKQAAHASRDNAARRASLADAAGKVPGLAEQLERAKEELGEYMLKVSALRVRAAGTARVGLVHDMASHIQFTVAGLESEADKNGAVKQAFDFLSRYEKEHGAMGAKIDAEAQAELPAHEQGLVVMQNRVRNLQRDLDSATQAKGQFDALAPAGDAVDASAEITEVEEMLKTARADRQAAANKALDIVAATTARAAAATKTAQALAHHNDVTAWTKVADALAPDGIPAEMLLAALEPVNAALEQAAIDTEWMQVVIAPDMTITAKGRPYQLLSESEQWRTDAMIAQVVSELSGLRILMLDRFDVLDLPGRAQCLEWLDSLAFNDVVDTVLLFGTLKTLPTDLADTITAYWVEGGTIGGAQQQAAA
jgi:energy-coupling factor transporter ATP-binding protein EcfA2